MSKHFQGTVPIQMKMKKHKKVKTKEEKYLKKRILNYIDEIKHKFTSKDNNNYFEFFSNDRRIFIENYENNRVQVYFRNDKNDLSYQFTLSRKNKNYKLIEEIEIISTNKIIQDFNKLDLLGARKEKLKKLG
jgi:hypothetical protein